MPPFRCFIRQRFIGKKALCFIFIQIWQGFCLLRFRILSGTFFAVVSCHITLTIFKFGNGKHTLIFTPAAPRIDGSCLEGFQLILLCDVGMGSWNPVFQRMECTAVGTHDTGNVRTNHFPSKHQFDAAKNRLIQESTSLNHDLFSGLLRISKFNYFI